MPLENLALDNVLECRVHGLCQNQEVINRFHFRMIEGDVGGDEVRTPDVLLSFIDLWQTSVLPVMLTTYGVYSYFCGRIEGVTYDVARKQYKVKYGQQTITEGVGASDTGTLAAGDVLPVFVAMDLKRRCNLVSKNTRGSVRISPHNESHQTAGSWDPARASAVKAALETYVPDFIIALGAKLKARHEVFSNALASQLAPTKVWPAGVSEPIIAYSVNPLVSSQTSRKIRQAGY